MTSELDRRALLAAAGTAALARALPAHASSPVAGESGTALRKSLMWGMVEIAGTLEQKFKTLREVGFEGVELESPSELKADEVLDALKASGLAASGVVDSVHWSQPLSDPDAGVREKGRAALETALRDAQRLGTDSVLLVPAIVNEKVAYDEAWTRSTAEIRKLVPLANELRVSISIENVWNGFLLSPLEAARYVDQFESAYVGWHLDLGNVVNFGWPEQWIRVLGMRIRRLHVKDYSRKKRDELGLWKGFDVELGEGSVDWKAVRKALDEIGYRGWASAEVAGGNAERLRVVSGQMDRILAS
jgi:L-ribulose-5-phosphate 3-epimerase